MSTAAGAIEPASVLDVEPIVLKIIDIVSKQVKENSRYVKKAPAVLRKFVRKYKGRLKSMELRILFGKSQIMDAIASAAGW